MHCTFADLGSNKVLLLLLNTGPGNTGMNYEIINIFYISAYRRQTIMILVSKYTFLRVPNPMGTFSILYY